MTIPGLLVTLLGMVGALDDHKISSSMQNFSSVQNFRYLGGLEASNSLTGREGGIFCVLSRVASQLKNSETYKGAQD